tara:strand:+ start:489 stop:1502 length:1014 start_codon:yes stop_codon:yes gene_type:complete
MTDLHITNGDGAANIIKESAICGDVLPWRDPMHHGPFPADLDLGALSKIRAHYLAGPGLDAAEVERDFRLRDEHLRAATQYDRIVMWFEHDLLDQLQILQLLDWFARHEVGATQLELICIDRFERIAPFRGIGQLNAGQMETLYGQRHPITAEQLELAQAGWSAFRSPSPTDLLAFMAGDLASLPFLHAALARHLEEYPWSSDGLTRTERQILTLASNGLSDPVELFTKNMDYETALFIGDWRTYSCIAALCAGEQALLRRDGVGRFWYPPHTRTETETFRKQRLWPTKVAEQILDGRRDAFDLIQRDHWLGGIHLQSDRSMWTWDAGSKSLKIRDC